MATLSRSLTANRAPSRGGLTVWVLVLALVLPPGMLAGQGKERHSAPKTGAPDLRPLLVTGNDVFRELVRSPLVQESGAEMEWRFALLENQAVNAYSDSRGRVWVGGGLAQLLGSNRGLWAAVLSHEMAHSLLRHPRWDKISLQLALPFIFGKVARNREHQADATGMILMGRAGYHPDFIVSLNHLLKRVRGEQSKVVAFLSSHPRWQTREERMEESYREVLEEFTRRYPDASVSPGGAPPLLVFLGRPETAADPAGGWVEISLPLSCRNAEGKIIVLAKFEAGGKPVVTADPDFQDAKGNLEARRVVACPEASDAPPVTMRVPSDVIENRKLSAQVVVLAPDGVPMERSEKFAVRLPAPLNGSQ